MDPLLGFEIVGERAFYRPRGSVSTGQLADLITTALTCTRGASVQTVLINISAMTGFKSPGPAYRRWAARRWAEALGSEIPVAMVARVEHICPEKTGLLVAAEEGVHAFICVTEAKAIAWLDAQAKRIPESESSSFDLN